MIKFLAILVYVFFSPMQIKHNHLPFYQLKHDQSEVTYDEALQLWQRGLYDEAEQALTKLANDGHANAQAFLASAYLEGTQLEKSYEQALHWCNQCALQAHESCIYMLGAMYFHGKGLEKDWTKALDYFELLAEQGHLQAQVNIGHILLMGNNPDFQAALQWIIPAAKEEHAHAQALLGFAYTFGKGVKRNEKKGYRYYRKAANNGSDWAQKILEMDGLSW